ncbi:MAG: hypothetical protein ACUVRJ_09400 [Candidatus Villigracilaceae bacterium]
MSAPSGEKNGEEGKSKIDWRSRRTFVLNLNLTMKPFGLIVFLALLLMDAPTALAQQAGIVTAPVSGQAVRGVVMITGTTDVDDFRLAEIAFAYQDDPTDTWFLIKQTDVPVLGDTLAVWDTTTITDSTYQLRLRIFLSDGRTLDTFVSNIRVRNYLPVETSTPDPAAPPTPPGLLPFPLPTDPPQPTPLPPNPVAVTPLGVYRAMLRGALVILALFIIFGLLIRIRRR